MVPGPGPESWGPGLSIPAWGLGLTPTAPEGVPRIECLGPCLGCLSGPGPPTPPAPGPLTPAAVEDPGPGRAPGPQPKALAWAPGARPWAPKRRRAPAFFDAADDVDDALTPLTPMTR